MALALMQQEVMDVNEEKGWYERDRTFGEDVALLHSEVSEALEEFRDYGFAAREEHYDVHCIEPDVCQCTPKPLGVGSEMADVFIRLLDTCGRRGIDLFAEYERKMAFNKTRPYRHGGKAL